MRALFITSTRLGDAVLSTGALSRLLERAPDPRVTVACGPVAVPLFTAVPGVERVLPMAKGALGAHWRKLWSATVATRWDAVVDLRGSVLSWFLLARERQVYRTSSVPGHRVEQIARALGMDPPPMPRLWMAEEDRLRAAELIGDDPRPLLAVAPTANWPPKAWPADRFTDLIGRLTSPEGPMSAARVLVAGGPGERDLAAPILEALDPADCLDLVGTAPLMTLAACLQRCRLVVANDSGLMHIAAATGAPTLGLFGPSDERRYAPRGPIAAWVRSTHAADSLLQRSGDAGRAPGALMTGLSVDAVELAVNGLL